MVKRICATGLIAVFLFSGTGAAGTLRKEFTKRIDFQPGGNIRIGNINGKVEVLPWKNNEVSRSAAQSCYFPARNRMRRAAPSGLTRLALWTVRKGKTSTLKERALKPPQKLPRTFGTAKGGLRYGRPLLSLPILPSVF